MLKNFLSPIVPFLLLALGLPMTAQTVSLADFYSSANGKKKAELKTAMFQIIKDHTNIGYDGLLTAYHESDVRPDGYLRDWYSNATSYVIGGPAENHAYKKEGDGYNREHSVPQSWFSKQQPMKSDLVHVIPTDGYVNNRRGNIPYGEVGTVSYASANNYSKVGACTVPGYTEQVFEPNDEIKGDIARIYFYMATRYEDKISGWSGAAFDGNKYPGLSSWTLQMMLRWAQQDPVDEREQARNEVVYKYQKNRNPFVDYPSLCEYVWGDSIDYAFDVTQPHGQSAVEIPVNPDTPDIPDNPDNPDDPDDPDTPDNPVNPDADSGSIDFAQLTWSSDNHATYGSGFTATANGLTLGYYKASSTVNPVSVSSYNELRFYDKSVFIISGAEVTAVTFHVNTSKKGSIVIEDDTYAFDGETLTWTGSMNPFICTASGQSRLTSIDVTIAKEDNPDDPDNPEDPEDPGTPDGLLAVGQSPLGAVTAIYDLRGRYLGRELPARAGLYLVRQGDRFIKLAVR